jgi:hypothetical protein
VLTVGLTEAVTVVVKVELLNHFIVVPAKQVPLNVAVPPVHIFGLFKALGTEGIGVTITVVEFDGLLQGGFAVATQAA